MNDAYNKTGDIDGIEIKLGGQVFTVPPLNFKQLKQLRPRIQMLQSGMNGMADEEKMQTFVDVVGIAMRRNYANLTNDELEDLLDLNNIGEVFLAILNSSGLVRKADSLGKLMDRLEALNSTGTLPTAPSSQTPDGPGSTSTTS